MSLALAPQGVLVKQVLRHLVAMGVHAGEVGNVVAQLLDGLHLLIQVVGFQEVTQLRTGRDDKCWFDEEKNDKVFSLV